MYQNTYVPTTYDPSNDFRQRRVYVFGRKKLKKKKSHLKTCFIIFISQIFYSHRNLFNYAFRVRTQTHIPKIYIGILQTYVRTRYRVYGERNRRRGVAVLRTYMYVFMYVYDDNNICMCTVVDGHKASIYVKRARGLHIIIRQYYVAL